MSQRDIDQNRTTLDSFKGRRCFASLATNSIRFRFDSPTQKGRYLWIDPPWTFSCDQLEITSSKDYTADAFEEWCELFASLRETVLDDFHEGEDGSLTLLFANGDQFFVPGKLQSNDESESDYDHWYAWDKED